MTRGNPREADPLTAEGIRGEYAASFAAVNPLVKPGDDVPPSFAVFGEIDSTNSFARRLISAAGVLRDSDGKLTPAGRGLHRTFYIADSQSAGRGRLGRSFASPSGCGLYFTLIFCPEQEVTDPALHTAGAAVAVARTLGGLFGIDCGIKWVNDVFFGGRKVCGILTEGVSSAETGKIDALVTGIGVNLREPPGGFPPEIRSVAGAVTSEFPPACASRNRVAATLARHLLDIYEREDPGAVLGEYRARSIILGKEITVQPLAAGAGEAAGAASYSATALDIDSEARLVVRTGSGEIRRLFAGEVRLKCC
jgi:BirA family biotin operon repressor/biotin-[acetyl-CoA-carboxylase] ligase